MTRTKLCDRKLPVYTIGEERMNMITHIVGGGFGVLILLAAVLLGALRRDAWTVVTGAIYGVSMIALYTVSSVYHGLRAGTAKKVMQVIDHCTIYLLIAGTYTPILLVSIRPVYPVLAWTIFGIQWGLTALAVVLNAIDLKKFSVISMVLYIAMGWCIIIAIKPMVVCTGWNAFWWILGGGISYTIGAVLYGMGRTRKYCHSVFHIFVDLGSLAQAVGILCYVL